VSVSISRLSQLTAAENGSWAAELDKTPFRTLTEVILPCQRRAAKILRMHRSMLRYQSRRISEDAPIRRRIEEIAAVRIRYGYRRITVLLNLEGWNINHKRVYRLYCQPNLHLRSKRLKRHGSG